MDGAVQAIFEAGEGRGVLYLRETVFLFTERFRLSAFSHCRNVKEVALEPFLVMSCCTFYHQMVYCSENTSCSYALKSCM